MARKKSRPAKPAAPRPAARSASPGEAAVAVRPAPAAVSAAPPAAAVALRLPSVQKKEQFWLEVVARRVANLFGSLQLAVVLLGIGIPALLMGMTLESWYSAPVASQLVYRSWWFTLLLFLLFVNIACAALKKWPWKKYQTGFLVTHLGLLMMLTGGVLNAFFGTDALIALSDSPDPRIQGRFGPQVTGQMIETTTASITLARRKGGDGDDKLRWDFDPGSFAWRADEYVDPQPGFVLGLFEWLSHPLPRGWEVNVPEWGRDYCNVRLKVENFYPHARRERFSPSKEPSVRAMPAVKFRLNSPKGGRLPEEWVGGMLDEQEGGMGPALVMMLGRCPPALLSEFLNPPAPDKASPKGTLVLGLEGRKPVRFDVAELLGGEPRPVGDTGWKVRVTEYDPAFRFGDNDGTAANPLVKYDLINPAGETLNFWAAGRLPGQPLPVNKAAAHFDGLEGWYHAPDYRWGKRQTRGVLDLVACGDKLYYRSFHSGGLGGFRFEASGPLAEGAGQPIWKGMDWEIQVLEFLPRAVVKERFVPVNVRPGLDREDLTAAIRCKLTVTPRNGKEQTQEFWVARTDSSSTPVTVGGETFRVGFNTKSQDLGFQVKLLRAEQKVDPGTQSPATYTSFVQLTDAKRGIHGEDRIITMNEPLEHNGYKLYQSGYMFLGPDPATGRPVNRSTLTVGYDPGIDWWFGAPKYTGLIMLVLGIVIMFYMKAYFFKPLARKAKAPGTKDGLPQVA